MPTGEDRYLTALSTILNFGPDGRGAWESFKSNAKLVAGIELAVIPVPFNFLFAGYTYEEAILAEDGKFENIVTRFAEVGNNVGNPANLRTTASAWTSDVGGQISSAAAKVKSLDGLLDWQGPAAEQYKQVAANQNNALDGVKRFVTDPIDAILHDVANANGAYVVALGTAAKSLVDTTKEAAASLTTIVGIPTAIARIDGAIGALSNAIDVSGQKFEGDLQTATAALRRVPVKGTPFGENGWIEIGSGASATLHDASAKDGNDSKWTPRRDT